MTLAELLPDLQSLSRDEKVQLVRILHSELWADQGQGLVVEGLGHPIWSPIGAAEAADALLRELDRASCR